MSADNFFVTMLDEQQKVELYIVYMSDEKISSDPDLAAEVKAHIQRNYKNSRIGVFDNIFQVRQAMEEYEEKHVVEYGPLMLHYSEPKGRKNEC